MNITEVPRRISELLGGRSVRWAPAHRLVGDYEGRERTIEVFRVPAGEQRQLLRTIRSIRAQIEPLVGGPLTVIFHTPRETERLYPEVGGIERTYHDLGVVVTKWTSPINPEESAYDPDRLDSYTGVAA